MNPLRKVMDKLKGMFEACLDQEVQPSHAEDLYAEDLYAKIFPELSVTQKLMILHFDGKMSNSKIPYQDLFKKFYTGGSRGIVHSAFHRLKWGGLMHYEDGIVNLTEEGLKVRDALVNNIKMHTKGRSSEEYWNDRYPNSTDESGTTERQTR